MFKSASRNILQKANSIIIRSNSVQREVEDLRDVVKSGDTGDFSNLASDFPGVGKYQIKTETEAK